MTKLTKEQRLEIYNDWKLKNKSSNQIAYERKLNARSLDYMIKLIDRYGIEIYEQNNAKFSKEFKEKAITKALTGTKSISKLSLDLGLRSNGILFNWIREYKKNGYNVVIKPKGRQPNYEKEADIKVKLDNSSQDKIRIVHDIKDSNSIYIYSTKQIIKLVNGRLKSKNIKLIKVKDERKVEEIFLSYDFQLFAKFYDLKQNPKYCCLYKIAKRYGYSIKTVDFIVGEIIKQPTIIIHIKQELNKKIKITPGA